MKNQMLHVTGQSCTQSSALVKVSCALGTGFVILYLGISSINLKN